MRRRRAASVPPVLPQIKLTIDGTGHARITADGLARRSIDNLDEPIDRHNLGAVLARVAEQAGGPVRVEIREPDGSRYADILQPRPDPVDPSEPYDKSPAQGMLVGEGFLPGEPVLVAVVAASVHADHDGTVRQPLPPPVPRQVDELILLGTNSGTILHEPTASRLVRRQP